MTEGFALVVNLSRVGTNTSSEISATLDVTLMPTHGAKNVHSMFIEANTTYEAYLRIYNFNFPISMRRLLLDSVRLVNILCY